jgi:hypothetical protein
MTFDCAPERPHTRAATPRSGFARLNSPQRLAASQLGFVAAYLQPSGKSLHKLESTGPSMPIPRIHGRDRER